MATHRIGIIGPQTRFESGVFQDKVGNQITAAAAPSIGEQLAIVMADGGADEGFYSGFKIPKNYVGSPNAIFTAVLDGAPGAADTLGVAFRKRAIADNEAADGAFDAEQTVSSTIGSNGSAHSDEDSIEMEIALTAGDYAVDDYVAYYAYIDSSGTTYTGNVLLMSLEFEYADA